VVRLRAEQVEVYVGSQLAARMPRLHGRGQHAIHYQHLIWSLVRKPGAFAHYRYRDDLFPTVQFRAAYDQLVAHRPTRADAEYLHVLHLAASTSEREVDAALALLLEQGVTPTLDEVRSLTQAPCIPQMPPLVVDFAPYDALLGRAAHG
jgi:hypothetical protein